MSSLTRCSAPGCQVVESERQPGLLIVKGPLTGWYCSGPHADDAREALYRWLTTRSQSSQASASA